MASQLNSLFDRKQQYQIKTVPKTDYTYYVIGAAIIIVILIIIFVSLSGKKKLEYLDDKYRVPAV